MCRHGAPRFPTHESDVSNAAAHRLFYTRTAQLYRWLAHGQHRIWILRVGPYVVSVFRRTCMQVGPAKAGHYARKDYFGATQLKFDASFKSPVPLYIATCG